MIPISKEEQGDPEGDVRKDKAMAGNVKQLKEDLKAYYEEMTKLPQETKVVLFESERNYKEYCKQIKNAYKAVDNVKTKGTVREKDRQAAELVSSMMDIAALNFAPKNRNVKLGKLTIAKHAAIVGEVSDFAAALKDLKVGGRMESLSEKLKEKQDKRELNRYMASADKQSRTGTSEKFNDVAYQKLRANKMLKFLNDTKHALLPDSDHFKALENSLKAFKAVTDKLPAGQEKLNNEQARALREEYQKIYKAADAYINRSDGSHARAERMDMARLIRDAVRESAAFPRSELFSDARMKPENDTANADKRLNYYRRMVGTGKTDIWERQPGWAASEKAVAKGKGDHVPTAVTKPADFSEEQMRGLIACSAFSDHCMTVENFEKDKTATLVDNYLPDRKKARDFILDSHRCLLLENTLSLSSDGRSVGNSHVALQQGREYVNEIMKMEPEKRNQTIGATITEGIRHVTNLMKEVTDIRTFGVGADILRESLAMTEAEGISAHVTLTEEEKRVARGYIELAKVINTEENLGMLLDGGLDMETRNERLAALLANELIKAAYAKDIGEERIRELEKFREREMEYLAKRDDVAEETTGTPLLVKGSDEYNIAMAEYACDTVLDPKLKNVLPTVPMFADHREEIENQVESLIKNSDSFKEMKRMTSYELLNKMACSNGFMTENIVKAYLGDPKIRKQVREIMTHGRASISQRDLAEKLGQSGTDLSDSRISFKSTAMQKQRNSLASQM